MCTYKIITNTELLKKLIKQIFGFQKNVLLKPQTAVNITANEATIFKTSTKINYPKSQKHYDKNIRCFNSIF